MAEIRRKPEKKKRKSGGESDDEDISVLRMKENFKFYKEESEFVLKEEK